MKKIDLVGQRFGYLEVLAESDRRGAHGETMWTCRCDCGEIVDTYTKTLRKNEMPRSCTAECPARRYDNLKYLIGESFDRLTIVDLICSRNAKTLAHCVCKCGKIVDVDLQDLKAGRIKSCGCLLAESHRRERPPKKNLLGKRFGRLTVVSLYGKSEGHQYQWECVCDCGAKVIETTACLCSHGVQSCGCLARENTSKRHKDITGLRFGKLTAIQRVGSRNQQAAWLCQCDCGNTKIATNGDLRYGSVMSCGLCNMNSLGEYKISEILKKAGIAFVSQKTFETCRFPDTVSLARFDFYLPEANILIEYDGIQHFTGVSSDRLAASQKRDAFKDKWCADNDIPLIRIPYTHFENISLEDLLLETSPFLMQKERDTDGPYCKAE